MFRHFSWKTLVKILPHVKEMLTLCMHVYICVCVYKNTFIHRYLMCSLLYPCIYIYICIDTYAYTFIYIYRNMHTSICVGIGNIGRQMLVFDSCKLLALPTILR